ncbi:MAG TPA: EVE domain-containing protein [Verrucomicrobiae bacterium]|jgi:predicted RNA-binding protein with PUA-like domain
MNHWIVKQEPEDYGWPAFLKDGHAAWTGVRSFAGRKNLRAMAKGDSVFYYHTGDEKQIVGLARVSRAAYTDPTADEGDWSCVDLAPVKTLARPVTLEAIKKDAVVKHTELVRQSRLSVSPLTQEQFDRLMKMAGD